MFVDDDDNHYRCFSACPKRLTLIGVEILISRKRVMNPTLLKALVTLVPAFMIFSGSLILFFRGKIVSSFLQLLGAGCLVVVVVTHVCEAFHLFPSMHWGTTAQCRALPRSIECCCWHHAVSCRIPASCADTQQPQAFPRMASRPSRTMRGTAKAAIGSAHLTRQIALVASPAKAISDR